MNALSRLSKSPEKLVVAGKTYDPESPQARTFLFIGDVVAWSYQPHICIINGLREMANEKDLKTAKDYFIRFCGKLDPAAFQDFRDNWTGVLGDVRRRHQAGRIWLDVPSESGNPITVISFWAHKKKVLPKHIECVRDVFGAHGEVCVDFDDRRRTLRLPGRPSQSRR